MGQTRMWRATPAGYVVDAVTGGEVAHVSGTGAGIDARRQREHARLLAAAPALAAALRALVEWGRTYTGPRDPHSPHTLLIAGVAALALVDGEESP